MDYEISYASLPIALLATDPEHPRKSVDVVADASLAASVLAEGVREPIEVCPTLDGRYLVIDGNRRLRAASLANLREVPCAVNPHLTSGEAQALRYLLQHRKRSWTADEHADHLHRITAERRTTS